MSHLEFQKQLEICRFQVQNRWDSSLSPQIFSRQTQAGINKLPNYIHVTLYKKSMKV